jgi:UDPglucose 6-dehydrogenase
MKTDIISLIGLGKLGLPLLCVFANKGQNIYGVDIDSTKVDILKKKICPFYEPELSDYLENGFDNIDLSCRAEEVVSRTDVAIILVNTPSDSSGEFSNKYIYSAIEKIANRLKTSSKKDFLFILSSTVMPSSHEQIIDRIEKISGRKLNEGFGFVYIPDLVALGSVIKDFQNPDVLIVGESDARYGDIAKGIYKKILSPQTPVITMSLLEAEITKISLNAYITMKLSFANFIGNITDKAGCRHSKITKALGYDRRISPYYIKSGTAFGGTCFPRDTWAFIKYSEKIGLNAEHIKAAKLINDSQHTILLNKVLPYKNKKIGILGLSFKPNTQVTIESPGQKLYDYLLELKYDVEAYDEIVLGSKQFECFIDRIEVLVLTHSNNQFLNKYQLKDIIIIDPWESLIC